ncbi:MAG: glycosyltransferase [Acidimicrobiia bacterium]
MTEPLVSVVIPTFNRSWLVQRAVESALLQTHRRVQVIVVDDGSADDTEVAIKDRFGNEERVTYLRTENCGPAAARNAGLIEVAGSHLALLDSDDEWMTWKLEFQLECLGRVPEVGMVWTDMTAVDADGDVVAERHLRTMYRRYREIDLDEVMAGSLPIDHPQAGEGRLWHGDLYRAMIGGNLVHTSTVLLTRERLERVGHFDETLQRTGEDFDFHLRTCAAGQVALADVPSIRWRVGAPDQLTRADLMPQMARNHLTTVAKAIDRDQGRLTEADRRLALAGAHGWLGEELLEAGLRAEAAGHLKSALRGRRRARALALLLVAKLPVRLGSAVRRLVGGLTRPFRRGAAG